MTPPRILGPRGVAPSSHILCVAFGGSSRRRRDAFGRLRRPYSSLAHAARSANISSTGALPRAAYAILSSLAPMAILRFGRRKSPSLSPRSRHCSAGKSAMPAEQAALHHGRRTHLLLPACRFLDGRPTVRGARRLFFHRLGQERCAEAMDWPHQHLARSAAARRRRQQALAAARS